MRRPIGHSIYNLLYIFVYTFCLECVCVGPSCFGLLLFHCVRYYYIKIKIHKEF